MQMEKREFLDFDILSAPRSPPCETQRKREIACVCVCVCLNLCFAARDWTRMY